MPAAYFGSASNPADNAGLLVSGNGGNSQLAIVPPASLPKGSLIYVIGNKTSATVGAPSVPVTGGQTWNLVTVTAWGSSTSSYILWWATFNGTWTADPIFDLDNTSAGTAIQIAMHCFSATSTTKIWALDVAEVQATYVAPGSPFDVAVTGITTLTNDAVALASWLSRDDNSWTVQTAGWAAAGTAQYRNSAAVQDFSFSTAYKLMPSLGATGNVTNRQTALGGDAGQTSIMAFKESEDPNAASEAPAFIGMLS